MSKAVLLLLALQVAALYAEELEVVEEKIDAKILKEFKPAVEKVVDGPILGIDHKLNQIGQNISAIYGGRWYCFQAHLGLAGSLLIQEAEMYAVLQGELVVIFLVRLVDDQAKEKTTIEETRKNPGDVVVYENSVQGVTLEIILEQTKEAIKTGNSFKAIAELIAEGLPLESTGSRWGCLVTSRERADNSTEVAHNKVAATLNHEHIYFGIGKLKVFLFNIPKQRPPALTELDYIQQARGNISNIKVVEEKIKEESRQIALGIVRDVIESQSSFTEMARVCLREVIKKLGHGYQCSIVVKNLGSVMYSYKEHIRVEIGPLVADVFRL